MSFAFFFFDPLGVSSLVQVQAPGRVGGQGAGLQGLGGPGLGGEGSQVWAKISGFLVTVLHSHLATGRVRILDTPKCAIVTRCADMGLLVYQSISGTKNSIQKIIVVSFHKELMV